MNKNFSLLLAAGALAAFLVSPLMAGHKNAHDDKIIYLKSGDMIIPFHGEGGGEKQLGIQSLAKDENGEVFYPPSDIYPVDLDAVPPKYPQPIGIRRMQLQVTSVVQIPALGIEDWELPGQVVIDIDFYEGDPYLLKFWPSTPLEYELLDPGDEGYIPQRLHGNPPLSGGVFGIHRITSTLPVSPDTMTEKYIVSTKVFSSGDLAGVVMTQVEHVVEPLFDPPEYNSTFTGFLYVPAHVDLEVVKKCAQKGKKKAKEGKKSKRRFRR